MLKNFEDVMRQVSDLIKTTEIKMRANAYVKPATFQDLKWAYPANQKQKSMRILFKERPLIEHPFEIRAEQFENLPGLVEMAKQEMNKHLSKISQDKIDRVTDVLNQM